MNRGLPPIPADGRLNRLLRRQAEHVRNATIIAKLAPETDKKIERPKSASYAPDPTDLRGIPAIGRSVAGAIPGTRPDAIAA